MHERTWKEEVQDIHLQVHSMHLSSIKTGWLVWQHTMEESNMSSHYSATVTLQSLVSRTEMDWSNVSSHYSSTMSVHLMKLTTQIEMIQVPPLNNDSSSSFNNLSDDSNLDEKMPPSKQGHLGIDLTGDSDNTVGILHDFYAYHPKTKDQTIDTIQGYLLLLCHFGRCRSPSSRSFTFNLG